MLDEKEGREILMGVAYRPSGEMEERRRISSFVRNTQPINRLFIGGCLAQERILGSNIC